MKRIISLLLILTLCLCSCLVKQEEKETPVLHVSEPIEQVSYVIAFSREDIRLAEEFDRILGEVMADGTARELCETHLGKDLTPDEPISANIAHGEDDSLARVREAGKLVIGYHKQNPPFSWVDSSNKAVGFDAELAREVCRRMGLAVEFEIIEWTRAEYAAEGETIDAVLSMEYTEERAKRFNLTRTYLDSSIVLLSHEANAYDSLSELTEKKVGVTEGSYAEGLITDGGITVMPYSATEKAYEQMKAKRIDAILADSTFVEYQKKGYAD
ncbi:MAG: transporter substrate-binding domain-containing protein [Clostridia bacterium]|nr:transporter substrate-binding domain-containing protein [Clostridia bacterium]